MKIKGNSLPQKSSQSPRNNYKLFQSSNLSVNPRPLCSLAQKGNYLTVALVSVSPNSSHPWIIDSGATDHMTWSANLFVSYTPCAGNQKVKIVDGSLSAIAGKGSIAISPSITLHDVLHVLKLSCNLLSINKLIHDMNSQAHFFPSLWIPGIELGEDDWQCWIQKEDSISLKMDRLCQDKPKALVSILFLFVVKIKSCYDT